MPRLPRRHLLLFLCALLFISFSSSFSQESSSDSLATWDPKIDDTIFPAVILSTSSLQGMKSDVIGDQHSVVGIVIKPHLPNARVHVEVRVDGLSESSSYDATLGEINQQYTVSPTVRFDTRKLAALEQPVPTTVVFSVKVNGADLGQKTKQVQVRAVNDVPFLVTDSQGHAKDVSPLFAAFVNENSPVIEEILKEALQWNSVKNFSGYQGSAADVEMQVFAVWNVLQRHQVKYSSITTASGFSDTIHSQTVRFVDDTWRMNQANCVDGSVLFASVLYKIGIFPVLVKLPSHMFVGYYTDGKSYGTLQNLQFLETTLVGAGHQPTLMKNVGFNPLLHPVRGSQSYSQFVQAVNYGNQEFEKEALPALQKHAAGYLLIDVRRARQAGISPISH
jgi:hypothetical protein